ncbi:MAG TPA: hypothetical protein VFO31_18635 [Vicinamibacterales bacterium]|nr:hypothetical protein [Vicinamibacterales bacterium]
MERVWADADFRDGSRTQKPRSTVKVLIEDSRSETRLLAEHMVSLMNQMSDVVQQLDRIERRSQR